MRLNDQRKRHGQFPDRHLLKGKKKIGEPVGAELAGECVGNDDRFLATPVLFFVLVWIESKDMCSRLGRAITPACACVYSHHVIHTARSMTA